MGRAQVCLTWASGAPRNLAVNSQGVAGPRVPKLRKKRWRHFLRRLCVLPHFVSVFVLLCGCQDPGRGLSTQPWRRLRETVRRRRRILPAGSARDEARFLAQISLQGTVQRIYGLRQQARALALFVGGIATEPQNHSCFAYRVIIRKVLRSEDQPREVRKQPKQHIWWLLHFLKCAGRVRYKKCTKSWF